MQQQTDEIFDVTKQKPQAAQVQKLNSRCAENFTGDMEMLVYMRLEKCV